MAHVHKQHAVIYVRSTSTTPGHRAAREQSTICHQMAREIGVKVVREFAEYDAPSLTLRRPGLAALFDYVETERPAYVIVADSAQLGVSTRVLQVALQLSAHGTRLAVVDVNAVLDIQTTPPARRRENSDEGTQ
ncbi:recombinase family protein [Tsukamurella tyrosinosolvens]|uniref:recombinase family protein n=1 Tax=Tsukamurella tyrosinosolvens TaxID=57704 RepID=UPI001CE16D2A|nr:recombinase family protein [Tsukamurella tyrosinosolvens]MCA4996796.1 recombinase family protein [Tsukamurella tyrosinosolvens]